MKDSVYAYKKGYLNDILGANTRACVRDGIKSCSKYNDPTYMIRVYTRVKEFTKVINKDLARNTSHKLTFHCTLLNCNVSARVWDDIQALIGILSRPEGDKYV